MSKIDLHKLLTLLPGIFMVSDRDFKVITANQSFVKLFPNRENVIGAQLNDLFSLAEKLLSDLHDVLDSKQAFTTALPDFADKQWVIELKPVLEAGDVVFIILNFKQEEQRSNPNELFTKLFEFNPAALAISRMSDSRIINVNESFLRLFDFNSRDEVIGKTSQELNFLNDPLLRDKIVRLLREGKGVVNMEGSIRTVKGNDKWVSSSMITANVNDQACIMAVLLDITDRKIAEDGLKKMNAELEGLVIKRTKEVMQTELEYHSIIEQATDGIFISDSKGHYVDVNPSACAMLGYSKDEFLTMSTNDLLPAEEMKNDPPRFAELLSGAKILSKRNLRRKDGSLLPVEINATMLANGRMMGLVRDITERKKEEEAIQKMNSLLEEKVRTRTAELEKKVQQLKESEDKFQKAFNASSAGIAITRISDSHFTEVNDAFVELTGYSREEVLNHSSTDLDLITEIEKREHVLSEIRERGSYRQMEMTIKRKSGETIEILSSIETILHNGERFAINIVSDITQLKQAQNNLQAANKELEAFSYSVSHDLRAPLRSIVGYSEIIREELLDGLNDELKGYLNRIHANGKRMGRLIDDLLEFARLGKQQLAKAKLDTQSIVERNISELTINTKTPAEFVMENLLYSYGDLSMLSQVWFNLISNALKYSAKKEKPLIHIGSYAKDNEIVFYIKDNGAGFDMKYSAQLFGVFQRMHSAADFEGTGVGLALVKRIVDKHGGRIWAEAAEGVGASFYFSLPT